MKVNTITLIPVGVWTQIANASSDILKTNPIGTIYFDIHDGGTSPTVAPVAPHSILPDFLKIELEGRVLYAYTNDINQSVTVIPFE